MHLDSRNVVITDFLCIEPGHGSSTVADQDTVPSPIVGIGEGAQETLIGVDSCEKKSFLSALAEPLVHGKLWAPHATHTGFVETNVLRRHDCLQGVVDVRVPCACEEATLFPTLVVWDWCTKTNMPAMSLVLDHVSVESSCDSSGHDF